MTTQHFESTPSNEADASRRALLGVAGLWLGAVGAGLALPVQADDKATPPAYRPATGDQRLQVVMLAHPDMTALDLVGPQLIFATMPPVDVHVVWKDQQPVMTDSGLAVMPTSTLDQAPATPDVLFVPGGLKGTTALLSDPQVLSFLRSRGSSARYIAGVCTGGLLLGAAGLLRGYQATAHWYVRDLLPVFDAIAVDRRVVQDRNRITGGGVTAGIDLALTLSALLRGDEHARTQQLVFEYAPEPPFSSGTPQSAGPALTAKVLRRRHAAIEQTRLAVHEARRSWGDERVR
ncbi:DJ-1/PfpI family protein [Caldimonas brevitalea]|uniref:Transcriptional regulator, AraC family n=1 Tax=Caldimonas brevitalea TaxID=413882 RepID=A0A0G3BUE7_9BURK|nr:DJ-1/PfpI family protein [Caldimonas brevitalea]AKJ30155.1 transcriptional regulator, AraC family [Caldimonas brevitalea]